MNNKLTKYTDSLLDHLPELDKALIEEAISVKVENALYKSQVKNSISGGLIGAAIFLGVFCSFVYWIGFSPTTTYIEPSGSSCSAFLPKGNLEKDFHSSMYREGTGYTGYTSDSLFCIRPDRASTSLFCWERADGDGLPIIP